MLADTTAMRLDFDAPARPRLIGDAARSPIVRRIGSVDQVSFGIGVLHGFRANP